MHTRNTWNGATQTVTENDKEDRYVDTEPNSSKVETSGPGSSAYQEFNAPSTTAMETKLTTNDNNLTESKSATKIKELRQFNAFTRFLSFRVA